MKKEELRFIMDKEEFQMIQDDLDIQPVEKCPTCGAMLNWEQVREGKCYQCMENDYKKGQTERIKNNQSI